MQQNIEDLGRAIVMEEGEIFFFYRPKNARYTDDAPSSPEARAGGRQFFMVLHPMRKSRYRLISFGRKHSPGLKDAGPRMRASIDRVMSTLDELRGELLGPDPLNGYRSGTLRPAAVQAAEGIYAVLKYRDHTHLIYALDYPIRDNGLLEEMGVSQEGGYTAVVRNPDVPQVDALWIPAGTGKRPDFPGHLLERFQGRDTIPVDPVDFLNLEGAELLLTGAPQEPLEEAGVESNSRNGSHRGGQ